MSPRVLRWRVAGLTPAMSLLLRATSLVSTFLLTALNTISELTTANLTSPTHGSLEPQIISVTDLLCLLST